MIPAAKFLLIGILIVAVSSYRDGQHFITFNTSGSQRGFSTSFATNLNTPFTVYSPLLFDTKGNIVTFTPNETLGKLTLEPVFSQDATRLYNQFSNGQYWYAYKKSVDPQKMDITVSFAFAKITVGEKINKYFLPMFNMPLSFLNLDNLYKCDDVLISYLNTGDVIDVTIISQKQSWHLFPEPLWGFRHKVQEINFSRQTFTLGSDIEIDVGPNKYCVLNDELPKNTYNLVQQPIYSLSDLFLKYSTSLQLKDKTTEQQL